jgi:hypothetical protein
MAVAPRGRVDLNANPATASRDARRSRVVSREAGSGTISPVHLPVR